MCILHTHLHIQVTATAVTTQQQLRSSTQQPTVTIVQCLQRGQRDNTTMLHNLTMIHRTTCICTYIHMCISHTHLRI